MVMGNINVKVGQEMQNGVARAHRLGKRGERVRGMIGGILY